MVLCTCALLLLLALQRFKRVSRIWHDPNYGAEMRPLRSGAIVSDRGAEDAYVIASAFARSSAAGGTLAARSSNIDRKACIHRW